MKALFVFFLLAFCLLHAETIKDVLYTKQELKEIDISQVTWDPWGEGFEMSSDGPLCDNGNDAQLIKGAGKKIILNQAIPLPLRVTAESKAEKAGFTNSRGYSLYLDIYYVDGTALYGQVAEFTGGTHDWETVQVLVNPSSPIRYVNCWLLFRRNTGKAWFRNLRFWQGESNAKNYSCFDKVLVESNPPYTGWLLRDVAQCSPFVSVENGQALDISITTQSTEHNGAIFMEANLTSDGTQDRILHLVYSYALQGTWQWMPYFENQPIPDNLPEYGSTSESGCSFAGSYSRFPMACVANGNLGKAVGIDLNLPVHGRNGYNRLSNSLFVSWDIALTPEKPSATVRLFRYDFDSTWGFRSALDKLYKVFPEAYQVRVKRQGLWMAFAPISKVEGWEDFGFAIKEGDGETEWDDAHGIQTYRYTEPLTWWMKLNNPKEPTTIASGLKEVERLIQTGKNPRASAFASSVMHDVNGKPVGQVKDTPWCNGIVWSMNSAPGIQGEMTDFKVKWGKDVQEQFHSPNAKGNLEGEYIDSSECYVTHYIDTRRDHFKAYELPLTYDCNTLMPGVDKLHICYEYIHGIEKDIHAWGKTMMANSTPSRIWFLAPLLDIMGTESNWNTANKWSPMSVNELFYRRAICGGKPYCFLQNTNFNLFSYEYSEKYMKRCLAFGMYPSYFSANASGNHYFKNPTLYNRDRPLFKKYVPLCRLTGEAGWHPITLARSSQPEMRVERFGENYFTVFNDNAKNSQAVITFDQAPTSIRDLVHDLPIQLEGRTARFQLANEDVALLEIK